MLVRGVLAAKRLIYGRRGEPYRIPGVTLRYLPGTRPVQLKYATSDEDRVARYDALEIETLLSGLKPGGVALDVGANAGQYAILMSALAGPDGTVVAFEPDPAALADLRRNIGLNPRVKAPVVEGIAVADAEGEMTLYAHLTSANSSLAKPGYAEKETTAVTVRTCTLDSYVAAHDLRPDWVKIDTEGAEIGILRGARRLLAGDANFLVELHPYAWPDFGDSFEELAELVSQSGRVMRYLDGKHPLTADPIYGVVTLERTRPPEL